MAVSKVTWLLPFIILVPLVLVYTVDSPLTYLIGLAIYAELYSVAQPGIGSLVVFLPYLIKRLGRGMVDVSVTFIGIAGLTILAQTIALFLPELMSVNGLGMIPWMVTGPMIILTTITAFLTIIAVHYNRTW